MPENVEPETVFAATMAVAAQGRWCDSGLSEIATEAGLAPEDLKRSYRDKTAILKAFAQHIDDQVQANLDDAVTDPDIPMRERLLEILLLRFEAMTPFRAGIAAILRTLPTRPALGLGGLRAVDGAMRATLTAAGVPPRGIPGKMQTKALAAIFLDTLYFWIREHDDDLSATTRRLDERLRRAEALANTLAGASRAPRSDRQASRPA